MHTTTTSPRNAGDDASPGMDEQLERQAIHWLVRLQSQPADPAVQRACTAWRNSHPAHERAWASVQNTYGMLQQQIHQIPASAAQHAVQLLNRSTQRISRRKALGQLGMLLAVACPVGLALREYTPWQRLRADYATATGERLDLSLDDGSRLVLNTDSAVRMHFDAEQRLILLDRGEIYLRSGADADSPVRRPLRVQTGAGLFQAVGTRFSVRHMPDGASRLHVEEGAVRLQPARAPSALIAGAGQTYLLNARGGSLLAPSGLDLHSWIEGQLVAHDVRLDTFLAELGRYRPGRLDWSPEVAALRISGTYQLRDTEQLLALLPRALPVRIATRTRYWVSILPRA